MKESHYRPTQSLRAVRLLLGHATINLREAFNQGLREHGYVEGQSVVFELCYGENFRGALFVCKEQTSSGASVYLTRVHASPAASPVFAGNGPGSKLFAPMLAA